MRKMLLVCMLGTHTLPGVQTQDQNTQRNIELDLTPKEDEMGDRIKHMIKNHLLTTIKELLLMGGPMDT